MLSRDEPSGATSAQKVVQTFERQAEATLVLRFTNGERIETTPEHPFYVEHKGFTPAKELGIGTSIVTRAGPSAVLASTEVRNRPTTVYNFEVENTHTYFVGKSDLWVHNLCVFRPRLSQAANAVGRLMDRIEETFAVVTYADLGTGTATNPASRTLARELGVAGDDAGHVIGNQLGGPGGAGSRNIFPQSRLWNRGAFAQFENGIAARIRAIQSTDPANTFARIRVTLEYNGPIATRPSRIVYRVEFGDGTSLGRPFLNP